MVYKICWNCDNYDESIKILTHYVKKSKIAKIIISGSAEIKDFPGFVRHFSNLEVFLTPCSFSRLFKVFKFFKVSWQPCISTPHKKIFSVLVKKRERRILPQFPSFYSNILSMVAGEKLGKAFSPKLIEHPYFQPNFRYVT